MQHHEKLDMPHCVYRIYEGDTLLYVGCSMNICGRLSNHTTTRDWSQRITKILIEWHPGWIEAAKAEARAILAEQPLHNRTRFAADSVGTGVLRKAGRKKKGDGKTCPRCGGQKEDPRPGKAYCNKCFQDYRRERKLKRRAALQAIN